MSFLLIIIGVLLFPLTCIFLIGYLINVIYMKLKGILTVR